MRTNGRHGEMANRRTGEWASGRVGEDHRAHAGLRTDVVRRRSEIIIAMRAKIHG
jgi:hypothetical protein